MPTHLLGGISDPQRHRMLEVIKATSEFPTHNSQTAARGFSHQYLVRKVVLPIREMCRVVDSQSLRHMNG
jgi:hypothetical protein